MNKKLGWLAVILTVILIAGLVLLFWDPILDALPIDQSGWKADDSGTFYLNADGDPLTGWQTLEGKRYYFGADGALGTGWQDIGGSRYYLGTDGVPQTGWLEQNGQRYYLDDSGEMATGWQKIHGLTYYFQDDGTLYSGWLTTEAGKVYLNEDGTLHLGWLDTDEGRCFLGADGIQYSGWLTTSEGTYYLDAQGILVTGWQEVDGKRYYLGEDGLLVTGWQDIDGSRYYLTADGSAATGWQDIDGSRYYMDDSGAVCTGWLELEDCSYYLKEDGTLAKGKVVIDGEIHYFTSTGASILLVNRWNTLPDNYVPDNLVESESGAQMTPEAAAALDQMIADCKAAGFDPKVRTSYRNFGFQQTLLNNKIAEGYSYDEAIQIVAIPGTSEHHTGLAVDISDSTYTNLNREQGNQPIQKWLNEHCWDYGFIVRYPDGTTDITGIIYESWHYRYVGLELAAELKALGGICLEEYLDMLTDDGTTCGNPDSLN